MFRLLIFFLLASSSVAAQLQRFHFTQNKMGSPFSITFFHNDSAQAAMYANNCYRIVDSLNNIFSDYTTESEIGKLAGHATNQPVAVSDELLNVLLLSKQAWLSSGKTFDVSIGTLSTLWRKARKEKRFPDRQEVINAKMHTGFANIHIDTVAKTVLLAIPGMRLDFGGIVKGYAAQRVIDYLGSHRISSALVDAGGDLAMGDPPPGKQGWTVGINLPEQENEYWDKKLVLKDCAVATSGDLYQFTTHNGKKYSHIIDGRTGYGVTYQRNVTVIAKDGATADWLATACSILPVKKALLLAGREKAEVLIATLDKKENIVIHKTGKFNDHFQQTK